MEEKSPTLEEWQRLFDLALSFHETAPWEWMTENDIFAVQHPETDELGFVSIMGSAGEHFAITMYRGERGLEGFRELQLSGEAPNMQMFYETPLLQLSFEDRELLLPEDLHLIKQLGLKFRGKNAWPQFRTHRPGFWPWHLGEEEAGFLRCAIEQTLEVAHRFREDRSLIPPDHGDRYLVRVPAREKATLVWRDELRETPEPEPNHINFTVNAQALETLKKKRQGNRTLEIDLFMAPRPISEKDKRPYFPYFLLFVDGDNGMIIGQEILAPLPALEAVWESVATKVVETLAKGPLRPRKILVGSELVHNLLASVMEDSGISVVRSESLPGLDKARAAMLNFLS